MPRSAICISIRIENYKMNLLSYTHDETGEHCKSNASRRAHDRRALTGEAGNASRRKVIVEATARSLEWASAWRTQDESGPTFSRVIRTNFGDRMAKIFRENSDSLAAIGFLTRRRENEATPVY
jgi:hypothetical protein